MEPLIGEESSNETKEKDRTELNSPLPSLSLPEGMTHDIESGMDPDDAFRRALQKEASEKPTATDPIIEGEVQHSVDNTLPEGVVISIHEDDVVVGEPRDYFAMGEDQEIQCLASCDNSNADRRMRRDRIVPCFANAPLKCFRGYCPRVFTCFGNRFRVCARAGNFTVLLERLIPTSPYSAVQPSSAAAVVNENDDELLRPYQPPKRELWLVMGPYWPFCLVLTTSLIVLIPTIIIVLIWNVMPFREPLYAFMGLTLLTLFALATVSCRDPGLMPHVSEEPEESKNFPADVRPSKKWIFNDLTNSWRPRGAVYDRDVNAVIDRFDHVCPFTGTAIGGNNMNCFYFFVTMINVLTCAAVVVGGVGLIYLAQNDFDVSGKDD